MTTSDRDMLEMCRQHFAFLGKIAEQSYLYDNQRKRVSPKKVIIEECQAAIDKLNQHLKDTTK